MVVAMKTGTTSAQAAGNTASGTLVTSVVAGTAYTTLLLQSATTQTFLATSDLLLGGGGITTTTIVAGDIQSIAVIATVPDFVGTLAVALTKDATVSSIVLRTELGIGAKFDVSLLLQLGTTTTVAAARVLSSATVVTPHAAGTVMAAVPSGVRAL